MAGFIGVSEDVYDYFKSLYLAENKHSMKFCWTATRAKFPSEKIPSVYTFKKRLNNEIPEHFIYAARYGEEAWMRRCGIYDG